MPIGGLFYNWHNVKQPYMIYLNEWLLVLFSKEMCEYANKLCNTSKKGLNASNKTNIILHNIKTISISDLL